MSVKSLGKGCSIFNLCVFREICEASAEKELSLVSSVMGGELPAICNPDVCGKLAHFRQFSSD